MDICGSWTTSAIACLSWNSSLTFGELEPRLPRCGTIRSHLIPAPAQFGCVSELLTYGSRTLCSDGNKPRLEGDHFPKGPRVDACPSSRTALQLGILEALICGRGKKYDSLSPRPARAFLKRPWLRAETQSPDGIMTPGSNGPCLPGPLPFPSSTDYRHNSTASGGGPVSSLPWSLGVMEAWCAHSFAASSLVLGPHGAPTAFFSPGFPDLRRHSKQGIPDHPAGHRLEALQ